MAQHGYLREYDEAPDRDDNRDWNDRNERSDRDWSARGERDWRDRDERDGGRRLMFDDDRDRSYGRDDDRGFFSRAGDEARSWFRDEEHRGGREGSAWEGNREWPQRNRGYGRDQSSGGFRQQQGGFSSHPDDHYRSWRDQHMQGLDRDYQDYCREREQQFHSDFDNWRQNRQQNRGQQNQSQSQGGQAGGQDEELVLSSRSEMTNSTAPADEQSSTPSPEGEATLGTNNPANTARGRR